MSHEFFRLHGEADRNHPFQHHDGRGCQSFDPSLFAPVDWPFATNSIAVLGIYHTMKVRFFAVCF